VGDDFNFNLKRNQFSKTRFTLFVIFLFCFFFPQDMREQMLKGGMVPKLVNLLKTPSFRPKTLRLLYHLSSDDRCALPPFLLL